MLPSTSNARDVTWCSPGVGVPQSNVQNSDGIRPGGSERDDVVVALAVDQQRFGVVLRAPQRRPRYRGRPTISSGVYRGDVAACDDSD
jgi:hypothetical protein